MMITKIIMMMSPGHAGCSGVMVGEATPAVLILVLLFITPSRLDFWPFVRKVRNFGFWGYFLKCFFSNLDYVCFSVEIRSGQGQRSKVKSGQRSFCLFTRNVVVNIFVLFHWEHMTATQVLCRWTTVTWWLLQPFSTGSPWRPSSPGVSSSSGDNRGLLVPYNKLP